jgi:hypothetical protein
MKELAFAALLIVCMASGGQEPGPPYRGDAFIDCEWNNAELEVLAVLRWKGLASADPTEQAAQAWQLSPEFMAGWKAWMTAREVEPDSLGHATQLLRQYTKRPGREMVLDALRIRAEK